jgi:hypothetical protein
MQDHPPERAPTDAEMRGLRLLRVLVTVLTGTMIVGIAALVLLLYLRLPGPATSAAPPALPDAITLPEGARAQAVTAGPGWWAVVTQAGDILIYDASGAMTRRLRAAELAGD